MSLKTSLDFFDINISVPLLEAHFPITYKINSGLLLLMPSITLSKSFKVSSMSI